MTLSTGQIVAALQAATLDDDLEMACWRYMNRVRNDNNFEFETNGEDNFLAMVTPFCRTVMDVGACVGDWTEAALARKPDAIIHCFEPLPANFAALQRNLGKRAFVNGFALGATSGEVRFQVPADKGQEKWELGSLYSRMAPGVDSMTEIAVEVRTLSDYCRDQEIGSIDLLKIDTEGAEMDVLLGGERLFSEGRVKAVQFEYGATWLDARRQLFDVFQFIASKPYVLAKLMPTGPMVMEKYQPMFDNFAYSNWAILHRDLLA
ncbi:FkbM family methyltransferase [Lacibacterium aquatile]|uniref:FkbM family methyltransferase n=1 Tax=Lacibacterium aquatile TaxID=1168082 RepID=A0ABW5DR60_9PROT